MLTGKTFDLNVPIVIPLPKNAVAGNVNISVTLRNSGNETVTEEVTLSGVAVPDFERLYLDFGTRVFTMEKENGLYVVEDLIPANAAGKIYTKQDRSGMFWGFANGVITGMADGNIPVGKSAAATLTVSFNTSTFELMIGEGEAWNPTNEAIYILGTISGHWADTDISEEQNKMKMTGYASGNKRYWTWVPPEGGDSGPEEGMWGNIKQGQFRFKVGGKEEYILFDGDKLVTGTTNDKDKSFMISTGGHVVFTLFFDGTNYNKLTLEVAGKSLEYTNDGFVVNGLPLPAAMTFAGGSLQKKVGTFWEYEGFVDIVKDQEFTATGVDLSRVKPDRDVFLGEGSSTWKMIGSSGNWLIRVDPFTFSIYACKTSAYPDVIYLDSWGWSKNEGESANNWNPATRLCLQRVDESSFIYEATFYHHSWGDDGFGPSMRLFANMAPTEDIVISSQHFTGVTVTQVNAMYMKATAGGSGSPSYMRVQVDLKAGFDIEKEEPVGDKFTITFTDIN